MRKLRTAISERADHAIRADFLRAPALLTRSSVRAANPLTLLRSKEPAILFSFMADAPLRGRESRIGTEDDRCGQVEGIPYSC